MSLSRQIVRADNVEAQRALLSGKAAGTRTPEVRDLDIDLVDIKLDPSAQPRENLNTDKTAEYAEAMKAGDQFPPIVVFQDGKVYWLGDGFHRHYAVQQAGRKHIRCHVHQGGLRDAILYSVGANATHGVLRSDNDKERAVLRLLADAEWSRWTDRDIAKRCRVSHPFVAKTRTKHAADTGSVSSMDRTFVHPKTGKATTMKTAGINAGRKQFQAKASEDNGATGPDMKVPADSVTGEASRLASGRTGAGEAVSADLPTNLPETAIETMGGLPVPAASGTAERTGRSDAHPGTGILGTPQDSGVTGGESAADNPEPKTEQQITERQIDALCAAWDAASHSARGAFLMMKGLSGSSWNAKDKPTKPVSPAVPPAKAKAGDVPHPPASPATPIQRKPLRPHCIKPDLCAGSGRNHCHACTKAMSDRADGGADIVMVHSNIAGAA